MKPYYDHNGITIYHADCREILMGLEFDAVATDPPYGVNGAQNSKTVRARGHRKNEYTLFEDSVEYVVSVAVPIIEWLVGCHIPTVLTPGNRCLTHYPQPDSFGAIYQPASVGLQPWGRADAQPIFYYGKSPHGGMMLPSQRCSFVNTTGLAKGERSGHPCPKPLHLWTQIVRSCSADSDVMCDPFMGSGTTLRAAKDLGRHAIGIEVEEKYCEIAARRLEQEVFDFEEPSNEAN